MKVQQLLNEGNKVILDDVILFDLCWRQQRGGGERETTLASTAQWIGTSTSTRGGGVRRRGLLHETEESLVAVVGFNFMLPK
jgi:hypothetical protein